MTSANEYGIAVRLVKQDGEEMYEARVAELPDVATCGSTYAEAYEAAVDAICGLQRMFAAKGKTLPPPEVVETEFSGRVTLRMSKSIHGAIHRFAALEGVSLNQWIVEAVACRVNSGKMAPASSVVLAAQFRSATGAPGVLLVATQHIATLSSAHAESINVFAPGSMFESRGISVSQIGQHTGRLTHG